MLFFFRDLPRVHSSYSRLGSICFLFGALAVQGCGTESVRSTTKAESNDGERIYAKARYGLLFFGHDDQYEVAVPGESNRFYDPAKSTFVFIPGWRTGATAQNFAPTFNYESFQAPDVDMAAAWLDKGWNVAVLDWTQFADTDGDQGRIGGIAANKTFAAAERRIWERNDEGDLVYYLDNLEKQTLDAPNAASVVGDIFMEFMAPDYQGATIHFHGHSLGTQMAITVAQYVLEKGKRQEANGQAFNWNIIPERITLTDMVASKCPKEWLPSTQPRKRPWNQPCLPGSKGDWVGERLKDMVNDLKASPRRVALEHYRCSSVNGGGLISDRLTDLDKEMAVIDFKPQYFDALDQNGKHAACAWSYLWSQAFPPPAIMDQAGAGLSASQSLDVLRSYMSGNSILEHTGGKDTKTPADDTFKLKIRP